MKVIPVCFVLSTILLFFGFIGFIGALILLTAANLLALFHFVFYKFPFEKFFSKRTGYNVFGVIEPSEELKSQVVVAGHHDAVHIFRFLESLKYQKYYSHRIMSGIISSVVMFVLQWIRLIYYLTTESEIFYSGWLQYVMLVLWIAVVPLYTFKQKEVAPGAGDNLVASAISVMMGKHYSTNGKPKHVRLNLASMDAEEGGMCGAKAYAKGHREELTKIPTYVFNIDSIYELNQIQFTTKDINGMEKLSYEFADKCKSLAERLGYTARLFPFTFGGGGTDAAEFARIGVKATTMIAMASEWVREELHYHTSRDTVDKIEPAVVTAAMRIAAELVSDLDSQ
jgi:hypothetical protein